MRAHLLQTLGEQIATEAAIHELPLEKQAEYADGVVKENAGDPSFLTKQKFNEVDPAKVDYAAWNASSVGNCAWIALHAKKGRHRKLCLALLAGYKAYRLRCAS